jgi:transglutaminase-like putative cysteine protease
VSSDSQVAVMPPLGRRTVRPGLETVAAEERPWIRLAAFSALALYGGLRWATLLKPEPGGRILGLVGMAIALAALGPVLSRRHRAFPTILAILAVLLAFALAGVPFQWVRHFRIAVTADGISEGLSGLPRALVPYNGLNDWIRTVIMLGAAILLLDAALMLTFVRGHLTDARRAAGALPLIALAVIPSTVVRPSLVYQHGLLLFVLLCLFMWGERLRSDDLATVLGLATVAALVAMVLSPVLDSHKPWVNYEALAGSLQPGHIEQFDWSQRYGPLNWPRKGHEVIDVQAKRPDYWKAENLDSFDGRGWVSGQVSGGDQLAGVERSAIRRWTQTIHVTIRAMKTNNVIVAGFAGQPSKLPGMAEPGESPGTWTSSTQLGPGDSYATEVYAPHPSPTALASAGDDYSGAPIAGYRTMVLPVSTHTFRPLQVVFPTFHSHQPVMAALGGPTHGAASFVDASPYGRMYALAKRLERKATTPYAFVSSVQGYLSRGFSYNEDTPNSQYPLVRFLFTDKFGYCQQFAGAMALMLRMGGIPARVAVGFTTGSFDSASHQYVVGDVDAHAWVEAWFPRYGWVRFDPTPAAAPARGGKVPILPAASLPKKPSPASPGSHGLGQPVKTVATTTTHSGGPSVWVFVIPVLAVLAVAGLALLLTRAPREPTTDELLAELERALARSGRPVADGTTLSELERRFRIAPDAAAYVRSLRTARFGGSQELPTAEQRRALRGQLRAGLGLGGTLRGLWALPPRWRPPEWASRRHAHAGDSA